LRGPEGTATERGFETRELEATPTPRVRGLGGTATERGFETRELEATPTPRVRGLGGTANGARVSNPHRVMPQVLPHRHNSIICPFTLK
jgi:hypothetical protein